MAEDTHCIPENLGDLLEVIPALSVKVLDLYRNDRVVESFEFLQKIEKGLHQHSQSCSDSQLEKINQAKEILLTEEFHRIRVCQTELERVVSQLSSDDGWDLVSEQSGIKTFYRVEPGSPTHSFRTEGIVRAPLFHVISCIYEVDLYDQWMPGITSSTKLQAITKFQMILQLTFSLPWPLSHREALIFGYGDLLSINDHTSVVIYCTSEFNSPFTPPNPPPSHVRADVKFSGFKLTPINENETMVSAIFNFDPKIAYVPYWFMNYISQNFCHYLIVLIRRQASNMRQNPESPHYVRVTENAGEVYSEVRKRFEEIGLNTEF